MGAEKGRVQAALMGSSPVRRQSARAGKACMLRPISPSPSESRMLSRRRRRIVPFALLALVALAPPARAAELVVDRLAVSKGELCADVHLVDLFDTRTRNVVASGLPITVRFATELWRDRSHWFDENVDARLESFRIRWDPGEKTYTLSHPGPGARVDEFEGLDELLDEVSHRVLVVHPFGALDAQSRYFVAIEVAVRPLTLQEFRDLDGWVEGRIRGNEAPSDAPADEDSGEGISGAVLGFLLDLSGWGDVILRARTPTFRPAEIGDLSASPGAPADRTDGADTEP
jgi:Domain of unknown function (DUF4390)